MKKRVSTSLAALLAVAMAVTTGCGSAGAGTSSSTQQAAAGSTSAAAQSAVAASSASAADSGEDVTLSFWKEPHTDKEDEYWADIISQFNKEYPNIHVEFLNVPWDSHVEKETAAFASGNGPDVSFQVEQYVTYAKNGYLMDLNSYISDDKKAGYPQSALDYCTYDGKLVGIPFIAGDSVMFYNKDLFAAAGITDTPKTWDDFLADAQKLTLDKNGDGETDQWGVMYEYNDYWQPLTFIEQAGGDLWNANKTNVGFNNDAGVKGLSFFGDLYNKYKVALPVDKYNSVDEERAYFYNGQVAMYPGQIQVGATIKGASSVNLGAFAIPSGPASDSTHADWSFANIGMLSICSQTKHPEEAWKFVEFVTRPEVESQYLSKVGFFSPQVATNDLMYKGDEIMALAAEGIKKLQVSPTSDYADAMFSNLTKLYDSVARGAASPKDAIQQLDDTLKAISGEE
jgi:multiple sugar transport system substrate-binding protein